MTDRRAQVIVSSTRASSGEYEDKTGPVIVAWLRERKWVTQSPLVVPDGPKVAAALTAAVASGFAVIITTGGTGLSPDDGTADATALLLDTEIPGIVEEMRRRGSANTPMAVLTRGHAGFAKNTFIVNLPGSTGGVGDGLGVLDSVLEHIIDQRSGKKTGH